MITTRSLLPASFTAFWTESYSQRSARSRLISSSRLAWRLERRIFGWLGRRWKPLLRASRRDARRASSDCSPSSPWQTTRTLPGPRPLTADASERASGTSPPAAGLTVVSGAGSGQ